MASDLTGGRATVSRIENARYARNVGIFAQGVCAARDARSNDDRTRSSHCGSAVQPVPRKRFRLFRGCSARTMLADDLSEVGRDP
jgi:hypothetical protein